MSFTPNNRIVTINDLDQPDAVPNPQRDPIGYDTGRHAVPARRRSRLPFGLFLLLVLVVLLVVGVVLWRVSAWLSSEYVMNPTFTTLVQLVLYTILISLGIAAAVTVLALAFGALGWAFRRHLAELPGGTPVAAYDLLSGWRRTDASVVALHALDRHFDVQDRLAEQSHYRNVTAYSPSISYQVRPDGRSTLADGGNTPPTPPHPPVPPFDALLAAGTVGPGNPLLLGIDVASGTELRGSWLDLYSTAVAGLSGGGKTTTQRFLAAQAAMHGARFVVCDPHYGAAEDSLGATLEPLHSAFLCDVADTTSRILDAVRLVRDSGERRITGKDKDATPLILWLDEATKLLGHSQIGPELAALLEEIAQQYRKRGVYASIAGQIWTADRTGGSSALRDSLASVLCHRMKRNQARLLLPTEEARLVERLPVGQAVLWRTSGDTSVIAIPNTTAADMQAVARVLTGGERGFHQASTGLPRGVHAAPAPATGKPAGSHMEASTHQASTAAVRGGTVSSEDARIVALFLAGNDVAAIVRQVYQLPSSSGRRYQERSAYVLGVIRQYIRRVADCDAT